MRFATELVQRTRRAVGSDFIIVFRISTLDLVEGGLTWLRPRPWPGRGLGWDHHSHFGHQVARGAHPDDRAGGSARRFAWATRRLREAVRIPVAASNRINAPEIAEDISPAATWTWCRCAPLSHFGNKARPGTAPAINI